MPQGSHQSCRTLILCVDSYLDGVPVGRFYHPGSRRGCTFRSMSQFLLKTEQTLNTMAFPQSFTTPRTLTHSPHVTAPKFLGAGCQTGLLATFTIRILFRQNASWQGSVRWLEGGREEPFRSVLELIFLLDSVLTEKSDRDAV